MAESFLIGQPIWHLQEDNVDRRWEYGVVEDDPSDESDRTGMPRKGIPESMLNPVGRERDTEAPNWVRLRRPQWIQNVLSDDPEPSHRPWHRVVLISGAGLGKTANLKWLCAQVNRQDEGRGRMLALFTPLRDLPSDQERLPSFVYNWLMRNLKDHNKLQLKEIAVRLLKQGRVLFLLDSLDEAGPAETGPAVVKLKSLLTERWQDNPVWVSGRPYAFRSAEKVLRQSARDTDWTFLRVGPLDEAEARQLVETASLRSNEKQ